METLPRGNGWKLMTTGGAVKAQVLDSWYTRMTEVGIVTREETAL